MMYNIEECECEKQKSETKILLGDCFGRCWSSNSL